MWSFRAKSRVLASFISRSWQVAWPMTLIMFFEFLIGLTDVFVAGRVGKDVQAAYGFVIQLYFMFIVVANALTVGTVSVVSRLFTAGDRDQLTTAAVSSLTRGRLAGAGILARPLWAASSPPSSYGSSTSLLSSSRFSIPLIQIYSAGLLFEYIVINCNGILRSCNMIKASLRTMASSAPSTLGSTSILVFYTPLGFRGIALATVSSVLIGSLINLSYVENPHDRRLRKFSKTSSRRSPTSAGPWEPSRSCGSWAASFSS